MNGHRFLLGHLLAGTSLIAMSGIAGAADIAKAPPPAVVKAAPWAGSYVGIHGGYGWMQDTFYQEATLVTGGQYLNGARGQNAVFGIQFGHNWQTGRLVTGLEADFSITNIGGGTALSETVTAGPTTASASFGLQERSRYLGTVRARAGWLVTDNLLFYGTAGLAWERVDLIQQSSQTLQNGGNVLFTASQIRLPYDKFGWVAGIGVEAMLGSPNWIGRVEYLHYDGNALLESTAVGSQTGLATASSAGTHTIDLVRAGISYKFGTPADGPFAAYGTAAASPSASSWAGFYMGGHGGYGWGNHPSSFPLALFDPTATGALTGIRSNGWIAGGHFGHNWQYGRIVTGLEADLDAANISGSSNTGTFAAALSNFTRRVEQRVDYLGTLRGRLGWLATDDVLLYGTAGLAWERYSRIAFDTETTAGGQTAQGILTTPNDRFGFAVGAGGEVKIPNTNWTGRIEYLHYDFGKSAFLDGSISGAQPGLALDATITSGRQTIDIVRAGASYRFGNTPADALASMRSAGKAAQLPASWTGFYAGAHGGYGWKSNDFAVDFGSGVLIGGIRSSGWLVGGHAGYNWQTGKVVAGLELDGGATGIRGSSAPVTNGNSTGVWSDDVRYLGTLRGRLGWTATETVLLYSTGGLAWERAERSSKRINAVNPAAPVTSINEEARDQFGWVAGVGGEFAITGDRRWIGRVEYLHYDFGPVENAGTYTSNITGGYSVTERPGRQTIDALRTGISYRFMP